MTKQRHCFVAQVGDAIEALDNELLEPPTMNGDDFYEEFKNSLAFLDVRWGDKALVDVSMKGNSIIFSYGNKSARIVIDSKEN